MKYCFTYILYSIAADKFYVGYTCDELLSRISKHNSKHRGFTAQANDWRIVHSEKFSTKQDAMDREKQIKAWKSRAKIIDLINQGS